MRSRVYDYLFVGALGCAFWRCGTSTRCTARARSLLEAISEVLAKDHLFSGFNCTQQTAEVHVQTLSACAPQHLNCTANRFQHVIQIDEKACLERIRKDLQYFRDKLSNFWSKDLTASVVTHIYELVQACFPVSNMDDASVEVSADRNGSFTERLQLCKLLKSFKRRAVTINRIFNHILSLHVKF